MLVRFELRADLRTRERHVFVQPQITHRADLSLHAQVRQRAADGRHAVASVEQDDGGRAIGQWFAPARGGPNILQLRVDRDPLHAELVLVDC